MRPGLVVVGVVLLVLAAGTSLVVLSPSSPADARQSSIALAPGFLAANQSNSEVIDFGSNPAGQLTVDWTASSQFRVSLFAVTDCWPGQGGCPQELPVAQWDSNSTGTYSASAPAKFPYLLGWTELSAGGGKFEFRASSSLEPASTARATWTSLTLVGAAIVLGVLGAGALFLGLFLRGGVFRESVAPSLSPPSGSPRGGVSPTKPSEGTTDPRTDR